MSEPKRLTVNLGDIMDTMERVYMAQRKRGFLHPRPNLPDAGDPRLEGIPDDFLEWFHKDRNCDVSPVVAWKTKFFRNQWKNERNNNNENTTTSAGANE